MKRSTPFTVWTRCLLLSLGAALMPACGGDESASSGGGTDASQTDRGADTQSGTKQVEIDHASPSSLFDSMIQAGVAGDNAGVISAYTPRAQQQMAAGMIAMVPTADLIPGADKPAMLAVLKRHGIAESDLPTLGPSVQSKADALANGIKDKPAFIAAMMDQAAKLPGAGAAGMTNMFSGLAGKSLKLTDLQTQGDFASAKVSSGGQTSNEDRRINFARVDGKWYVSPEDQD
ncbi:MAG: hypothetical protein ACE37H_09290 [Phycisphaeraceae bacterium]